MRNFRLYTIDQEFDEFQIHRVSWHPEETWEQMLKHQETNFRYCPDTVELWLSVEGSKDEVQLWKRGNRK